MKTKALVLVALIVLFAASLGYALLREVWREEALLRASISGVVEVDPRLYAIGAADIVKTDRLVLMLVHPETRQPVALRFETPLVPPQTVRIGQADVWPLDPEGKLIAMIQIESPTGIDNLDEILDVPGIGVIFLGPTDMATAIDAEGPNAPEVESLVQGVLQVCVERNIPCGYPIVATSPEEAERETARRLAEGFKVLAVMTSGR